MKTAASSSDWIKPDDMQRWMLALYPGSYNGYTQHYKAATRRVNPNRISVERMEAFATAVALQNLRGTEGLDKRLMNEIWSPMR